MVDADAGVDGHEDEDAAKRRCNGNDVISCSIVLSNTVMCL